VLSPTLCPSLCWNKKSFLKGGIMGLKGIVVLIIVVFLGISYGVYKVSAVKSTKSVASYYEEQQKAIDEINRFLDKK